MRTVYLGTSEFAAAVLRRLAASEHRPSLVVTRPDRRRGRGQRLAAPPIVAVARELEIDVAQPESVNDEGARAAIALSRPEAVCVCAFGALIKDPLLSEHWMLNVHPSLLPRWRGAAPIERAIIAGDEVTGASILKVVAALDSGPVYAQATEPIAADDTYGTLSVRLRELGGELLVRTLDASPAPVAQEESLATYAEKISPADRVLDPARPAVELDRVVRALTPHIGAHVELDDGRWLGVREVCLLPDRRQPGLSFDGPRPVLGCSDGSLELLVVQPPGRREMSGEEFLRGLHGRGH